MGIKKYVFGKGINKIDLTQALVAYYNFQTNANNQVSVFNNGSLLNGATLTAGKFGNSSTFPYQTGARIEIPNNNFAFNFGNGVNDNPFSISYWVKFSSINFSPTLDTGNWMINKRTATNGGDQWQIVYFRGEILFVKFDKFNNSLNQTLAIPFSPTLNQWYYFSFTDNGTKSFSGMSMYINGVKQIGINKSVGIYTGMSNENTQVVIGNSGWNTNLPQLAFNGQIDEVGIWNNRQLRQSEVLELYNSGNGNLYPFNT